MTKQVMFIHKNPLSHSTDGFQLMYLIISSQMHNVCKTLLWELQEIHHEPNRNPVLKVEISKAYESGTLEVDLNIKKKKWYTLERFYLK